MSINDITPASKEIRIEGAVNAAMHHYGYADDDIWNPNELVAEELSEEERMVRIHLSAAELVDSENSVVRLRVDDSFVNDLILHIGALAENSALDETQVAEEVKAFLIDRSEEPLVSGL